MEFLSDYYELDLNTIVEEEQMIYDNVVSYMESFCAGYAVSLDDDLSQSLISEFPLLQPILFSSYLSDNAYTEFIKENNFSYQKVK